MNGLVCITDFVRIYSGTDAENRGDSKQETSWFLPRMLDESNISIDDGRHRVHAGYSASASRIGHQLRDNTNLSANVSELPESQPSVYCSHLLELWSFSISQCPSTRAQRCLRASDSSCLWRSVGCRVSKTNPISSSRTLLWYPPLPSLLRSSTSKGESR
jgi:hypothetical protein